MRQFVIWVLPAIICCSVLAVMGRQGRGNLISFNAVGHDVGLGLDLEMPFIRVPVAPTWQAMLNVNLGAIATAGIVAGGGLLVGYLLKTLGLQGTGKYVHRRHKNSTGHDHSGKPKEHRLIKDDDYDDGESAVERSLAKMLKALKVVYTNTTGERTVLTVPELTEQLSYNFAANDIDLPACIMQSICTLVQRAQVDMQRGQASAVQQIIDGLTHMPWLLAALHNTPLAVAVQTGTAATAPISGQCTAKYVSCKWQAPEEKLYELLRTHVRFT